MRAVIFNKETFTSQSVASRAASLILLNGMRSSIVEFEFVKRDGSIRHAFGTRMPSLVVGHVVGGEGPAGVISFWDCEIAEWRSVRPGTVLKIYQN